VGAVEALPSIVAVAVLLAGSAVAADPSQHFLTGDDLLQSCRASEFSFEVGEYLGFVMGVADQMATGQAAARERGDTVGGLRACPSPDVTGNQVRDAVVAGFLTRHPEHRHFPAPFLVVQAIAAVLPCPKRATWPM
jgi:hypothetical protein